MIRAQIEKLKQKVAALHQELELAGPALEKNKKEAQQQAARLEKKVAELTALRKGQFEEAVEFEFGMPCADLNELLDAMVHGFLLFCVGN